MYFCFELKMAEIELGKSERGPRVRTTTFHQLHFLQNTTVNYYISFIERTYQHSISVLYFDTSNTF